MILLDRDYVLEDITFGSAYESIVVKFDDSKHHRWMHDDVCRKPQLLPHVVTEDARIKALMQSMHEEIREGCPTGKLYGESLSLALISYVWSRYARDPAPARHSANGLSGPKLRRILEFIECNLASDLRLAELANLVDLSPRHFCRSFKQATGASPHQYVLEARIERSKAMLAQGRQPIAEIALSVGFASQSHFSDAFRKQTGVSPRRYLSRF